MRYAIALMVLVVLALSACSTATDSNTDTPEGGAAGTVEEGSENAADFDDTTQADVVINMVGGNFYFEVDGERNPTITVQEGQLVRINFESVDGFHDVVIDELSAASAQVQTGGVTFVEFVADETGTFDYYCSVGTHRERGMVGQIVVE